MNEEPEKNEEPKKNKKKWILICVLIVVLICAVVFASTKLMNKTEQNQTEKENKQIYIYPYNNIDNDNTEYNNNNQEYENIENKYTPLFLHESMKEKPIIYLYPEEETILTVKLGNPEKLTCTYPKYKETGWNVTAYPDGTLVDNETGRSLYSLYWEGLNTENIEFNNGFCVKGEDTIKFLEEKLEILGLNEREAEEFIVYWLPKMEGNSYNLIRFASMEEIENNMPLEFSVKPDTVIRVLMEYKPVENFVEIPEQKLETPTREGFVAVEWGGTETY